MYKLAGRCGSVGVLGKIKVDLLMSIRKSIRPGFSRSRGLFQMGLLCAAGGALLHCASIAAAAGEARSATAVSVVSNISPHSVAWLEITGALTDRPDELAWLMGPEAGPTLRDVVQTIRDIGEDADYAGLMIRLKDAELTATDVQELGAAIKATRAAGKKVHIIGEYYDTTDFLLASYSDGGFCQPGGAVSLPGMYMEEMFLADTLSWAGVKADFVQVGDYKGASEQLVNSKPSKAWDENINQLLDSMYGVMRSQLKSGTNLNDAQLDEAMTKLWMGDAADAVETGLLEGELNLPDAAGYLERVYGGKVNFDKVDAGGEGAAMPDMSNPFAMMSIFTKQPDTKPKGPTIAVLHIDGAIIDGDSVSGFSGEGQVGSRTIRNALLDIKKEDLVKGVVIRIDSPGGSATASEIIWQGVQEVAQTKPVWVSVGDMAASGGYYIAVSGSKIYVNDSSIVGSIGVVGGKLSMQGLYDKLQVGVVGRARGPMAGMFASGSSWDDAERAAVRGKMTSTYDLFTKRVTAGREGIDLNKTAEGRLFTGDKAIELKMADKKGGLHDAITDLAAQLTLKNYHVMDYPGPRPLGEVIEDALKGLVHAPGTGTASLVPAVISEPIRAVLGDAAYTQIESSLSAVLQMRDGKVMLIHPRVLIWK
jgi:protease-4